MSSETPTNTQNTLATKVRIEDLDANIKHEFFFTAEDACFEKYSTLKYPEETQDALARLTICVLVLQNGFTCTGTNACVSKEDWSAEIGKRMAKEMALEEVWTLMAYELKTQQHLASQGAHYE